MDLTATIKKIYPDTVENRDFVIMDNGEGPFIAEWNLVDPQPTEDQLAAAWNDYQLNPPVKPLSAFEQLQKDQADLILQLVTKGVI